MVQCAALVETNHGKVNLTMNEDACYGKDTPSIPLDRLSGSITQLMTDPSKLVENRGSACLMDIPYPWCAEVVSCTLLALEIPQMRIFGGTQLYT